MYETVKKNMDLLFAIDRNEQIDILPSIKEIYFVLKNNLISKKDLIMYKLVIDTHLVIFENKKTNGTISQAELASAIKYLIPCSKKFYKSLDDT